MHKPILIAGTLLVACSTPDDVAPVATDSNDAVVEEACATGFKVGHCPEDFTLPATTGADVALSDFLGQRVAVVGVAEF